MDHFTRCPLPAKGGADCWQEPHPASRYGLCEDHWRKAVEDWCADQPTTLIRCTFCDRLGRHDTADLGAAYCIFCNHRILVHEGYVLQTRDRIERPGKTPELKGVVYYFLFGDRIKIGFTTGLRSRALSVPNDEVLAAEPGTYSLERSRHAEFGHLLIPGQREWFAKDPELLEHAALIREDNGDPFDLGDRFAADNSEAQKDADWPHMEVHLGGR